jgi:hypothetical protein
MTEPVRKQMLTALGDVHRTAASAAANAGLRNLAREHYMRSMDCAGEAGDLLRAVFALDSLGPSDQPRPWKHFATCLSHIEDRVYFVLGRFHRAVPALSAVIDGASHAVGCAVDNSGLLTAAHLRNGDIGSGWRTAQQGIRLAKGLRSVSIRRSIAPLQEAAAARQDSVCQDLARQVATLRSAA